MGIMPHEPTGIVETLERQMTLGVMMASLDTIFVDYPDVSPEDRAGVVRECNDRRLSILGSLRDVVIDDDESEAVLMLPGMFLELRFEWSRYNSQIQYQSVKQGAASPQLLAKGSVISLLLGIVEANLTAEDVFWVNRIAADPIASVASRGDTVKRLLQFALSARDIQRRALDRLDEMARSLRSMSDIATVHAAIERAKDEGVAHSDRAILLNVTEIHDVLELLVVEKLAGRTIRVMLQQGNVDAEVNLLPEVVLALREALSGWLEKLFEFSVEATAALREANHKSAHLNLRWNLNLAQNRLSFEMEDDGCGKLLETPGAVPDDRRWAQLRLRITAEQAAGIGGKISISAESSSFGNFMVCAIRGPDGEDMTRIALVTTTVMSVLSAHQSVNRTLGTLRLQDGLIVPIVDFRNLWPDLNLSAPTESSVFVVITTEHSGLLALQVDEIPGSIRGAMMSLPDAVTPLTVSGVLMMADGFVLVLDTDRLAAHLKSRSGGAPQRFS
jgi:chemotaxis signal transduction protein